MFRKFLMFAMVFCVLPTMYGCASNFEGYQEQNWYHDGYSDEQLSPTIYKVRSSGRRTDFLTVQTFWLLRAANLTLEKGYDGFEILPPQVDASGNDFLKVPSYRVACPDLNIVCTQATLAPGSQDEVGNIRLIKGDIDFVPLKVFDAHVLKMAIDKIKDNNCGPSALESLQSTRTMKLCPHDKSYLYSKTPSKQ